MPSPKVNKVTPSSPKQVKTTSLSVKVVKQKMSSPSTAAKQKVALPSAKVKQMASPSAKTLPCTKKQSSKDSKRMNKIQTPESVKKKARIYSPHDNDDDDESNILNNEEGMPTPGDGVVGDELDGELPIQLMYLKLESKPPADRDSATKAKRDAMLAESQTPSHRYQERDISLGLRSMQRFNSTAKIIISASVFVRPMLWALQ
ncbi:hypothetical protein PHYBOEH_005377 [Phytophthora boehmeriae]|uniref:Uncharacterized protein n=1 Tax=Phytophthora boehmeriae TaxID=109152 RepID=A0A8T1WPP4_9STRA|nr:hypothetical protein PHYBOEH_005377 [Phytophthora boehmeriae]